MASSDVENAPLVAKGEQEEEREDLSAQKFTLLDFYHTVKEINVLRGGGGWTGSLAESLATNLLSRFTPGPDGKKNYPVIFQAFVALLGAVLLGGSFGLDVYMAYLGGKYYNNTRCEQPLDHLMLYMGLSSLAMFPLSTMNKVYVGLLPAKDRVSASGVFGPILLAVPILQLVLIIVGCGWAFAINSSAVTHDIKTTACEPELYEFAWWYCLVGLVLVSLMLWVLVVLAIGMCLGSKAILDNLPQNIKDVRYKAESHRRQIYKDGKK